MCSVCGVWCVACVWHVCGMCVCGVRVCVMCVHVCGMCVCGVRVCVMCVHVCGMCVCVVCVCVVCVCVSCVCMCVGGCMLQLGGSIGRSSCHLHVCVGCDFSGCRFCFATTAAAEGQNYWGGGGTI